MEEISGAACGVFLGGIIYSKYGFLFCMMNVLEAPDGPFIQGRTFAGQIGTLAIYLRRHSGRPLERHFTVVMDCHTRPIVLKARIEQQSLILLQLLLMQHLRMMIHRNWGMVQGVWRQYSRG
jgi:hypothetical protein